MSLNRGRKARHLRPPVASRLLTVGGVNIRPSCACALSLPLLLTLAAAAWAAPAAPTPPPPAGLAPAALKQALALVRESAAALAPAEARIVVEVGPADPRLRLAPCAQVQAHLPAGSRPWGRSRVGLRCLSGPTRWNIYLPVTVQAFATAWVAEAALPAGLELTAQHLKRAEVDWAAAPTPPFAELPALAGRTLAQPLQPGQPPRLADLQAQRWFSAGQTVQILASGAGFAVGGVGQALTDGVEGREARVRTDNGRVLIGRPTAERRLEVKL
jgi:flagella basal body P-ring formation protein FlgA